MEPLLKDLAANQVVLGVLLCIGQTVPSAKDYRRVGLQIVRCHRI